MHPALDKRVFAKEAVTLANAGHEVVHLAPGEEDKEWRTDGVRVITYKKRGTSVLSRLRQFPQLYRRAAALDVDAYHCNEVDSWIVGIALKALKRRKVVFDVHEHYPSDFAERRFPKPLQAVVAQSVRLLFRILTPFTDRLVLAKKAIDRDFPAAVDRKVLVENFADLAYADVRLPEPRRNSDHGPIVAIHLGEMGVLRGWPQLLDALQLLDDERLLLEIVGRFGDGSGDAFKKRVAELGVEESLRIYEWLPFAEAYRRILSADIGLILFQPGYMNHVLALPHKMFDYMMAGIPIIAPRFAVEVADIVRDTDCGLLIDPSKPSEIAEAILRLMDSPEDRRRMGENGRRGVLQKYNWTVEGGKLLQMYSDLSAAHR
ncbi:MAG TPA: glycosyltransferase [Thermoanaerobaculia bacterium]|nr:glycosyltransferase [Thermoanaerobaculia bacterium]